MTAPCVWLVFLAMLNLSSRSKGQTLSQPTHELVCSIESTNYNLTIFIVNNYYYDNMECENSYGALLNRPMFRTLMPCIDKYAWSMTPTPAWWENIVPMSPIRMREETSMVIKENTQFAFICVKQDEELLTPTQEFNCTWDTSIIRMMFYDNLTNSFEAMLTCTSNNSTLLHISVYRDMETCIRENLENIQVDDLWKSLHRDTEPFFFEMQEEVKKAVIEMHRFVCTYFDPPVITEFYVQNVGNETKKWQLDLMEESLLYPVITLPEKVLIFTCRASGYPVPDLTLSMGRRDSVHYNSMAWLENPDCNDSNFYACTAENIYYSQETSTQIMFTSSIEIGDFTIVSFTSLTSESIHIGFTVDFKCSTKGCTAPEYLIISRHVNNTVISRGSTQTAFVQLFSVKCSDMDIYICTADLGDGHLLQESKDLVISGCPVQLCSGEDIVRFVFALPDDSVRFSVCLISEEMPSWKNMDQTRNISVNFTRNNNSRIYWTAEITVYNIKDTDYGIGILRTNNKYGRLDYQIILALASPVQLCWSDEISRSLPAVLGQTVNFSVCLISEEMPSWENMDQTRNISVNLTRYTDSKIYWTAEIIINNITDIDYGPATMRVNNKYGSLHYQFTLRAESPVQLCSGEELPRSVPAVPGQPVNFSVCLISEAMPYWENMDQTRNISVNFTRNNNSKIYWTAEITVYNITDIDYGTDTLRINNTYGSLDYQFTLIPDSSSEEFVQQQSTDEEMNVKDVVAGVVSGVVVAVILTSLLIAIVKRRGYRHKKAMQSRDGPASELNDAIGDTREVRQSRIIDDYDDDDHYEMIDLRFDDSNTDVIDAPYSEGYTEFIDAPSNHANTVVINVPYNHAYIDVIEPPINNAYIDVIEAPINNAYIDVIEAPINNAHIDVIEAPKNSVYIDAPYNHVYIDVINAPHKHAYIDVIDAPYNDTYTELAAITYYDKLLPTLLHYVYAEMINVRSNYGYTDLLDVVSNHVDTQTIGTLSNDHTRAQAMLGSPSSDGYTDLIDAASNHVDRQALDARFNYHKGALLGSPANDGYTDLIDAAFNRVDGRSTDHTRTQAMVGVQSNDSYIDVIDAVSNHVNTRTIGTLSNDHTLAQGMVDVQSKDGYTDLIDDISSHVDARFNDQTGDIVDSQSNDAYIDFLDDVSKHVDARSNDHTQAQAKVDVQTNDSYTDLVDAVFNHAQSDDHTRPRAMEGSQSNNDYLDVIEAISDCLDTPSNSVIY